jgi:hypothetical protein
MTGQAIENFRQMQAHFCEEFPLLGFCACGDFAVIVKSGPHTGKPFSLCLEHSRLWTEQRLGITEGQ